MVTLIATYKTHKDPNLVGTVAFVKHLGYADTAKNALKVAKVKKVTLTRDSEGYIIIPINNLIHATVTQVVGSDKFAQSILSSIRSLGPNEISVSIVIDP